jgi:hypothetical protein
MKIPRYEMILWWSDEDGCYVQGNRAKIGAGL